MDRRKTREIADKVNKTIILHPFLQLFKGEEITFFLPVQIIIASSVIDSKIQRING